MITTLFLTAFITVFLAELGDKTQLTTIAMSSTTKNPFAVFLGSSTALIMASYIGAMAGGSISNLIPGYLLKIFAAIVFLYIGTTLIFQSSEGNNTKKSELKS